MSFARRSLLLIPAALAAFAVAGCDLGDDGPRTTQTRDVADFTRIENRGSVDVRLRVGEPQRVRVRAGEKVIDDVRTVVRDGTLQGGLRPRRLGRRRRDRRGLRAEAGRASRPRARATSTPTGSAPTRSRSARTARRTSRCAARRAGSTVDLDGSGDADLGELEADEARVNVGGSGDADVRADKRLDVNVDGSGDVRYHGDPELTKDLDGSGDLSRAS